MIEVLKQALEAFRKAMQGNLAFDEAMEAFKKIEQAIKELESQETVAWRTFDGEGQYEYRAYEENESYADDWNKRNPNHKGWVEPLYTHPPQRTEQNFCPRCGKRTNDIHTCTPPQGIYYTPPQRKPLTDEQAYDLFGVHYNMSVIRNVEAAHGIKGET